MKKQSRSSPWTLLIPLVVVIVLVLAVVVYRISTQASAARRWNFSKEIKNLPGLRDTGNKPSSGFGKVQAPTNNEATVDLARELNSLMNDSGASEVEVLKKQAAGL